MKETGQLSFEEEQEAAKRRLDGAADADAADGAPSPSHSTTTTPSPLSALSLPPYTSHSIRAIDAHLHHHLTNPLSIARASTGAP